MKMFALVAAFASFAFAGCATYQTPGAGVSIPEITSASVAEALARKPAATWPARLVLARVQANKYWSYTNRGQGDGRFSIVTQRDIETEADIARLSAMPKVAAVGMLNRLLVPARLESADDVRTAAAQLQGDIVVMYTIDTSFRTESGPIPGLQLVSVGMFPGKKAKVSSTCAVALLDTRTGFVYGVAESTADGDQRSDSWHTQEAIEKARARTERSAFTQALGDV
jgi:hypothetical protein